MNIEDGKRVSTGFNYQVNGNIDTDIQKYIRITEVKLPKKITFPC